MFEQIFSLGSTSALASWTLLSLIPTTRLARLVTRSFVPIALSVAYTGLIMAGWTSADGGFSSLDDLKLLFKSDAVLVAGWLHYLAFDLLIGVWIDHDARERGIPHWSILPALVATFLFGPAGYVLYRTQRFAWATSARESGGLPVRKLPVIMREWVGGWEPTLIAAGLALLLTALPTLFAYFVDPRLFSGEAVWLKPLRFELSLAVYLITLAVFYPLAGTAFRRTRAGAFVIWGSIVPAVLEVIYIAVQAGRGLGSHFNTSSALYTSFYAFMGISALVLTAAAPVLGWGLLKNAPKTDSRYAALHLAIALGLFLTFVLGAAEGSFMSFQGGHFSSHGNGGASLPVVGWSRVIGDYRVAHFLGIHAMQVIPVVGLLSLFVNPRAGRFGVLAFGFAYTALVVATFVQALLGLPVLPV